MTNELHFNGRIAIVTGAGGGLGKAYALLLASRGAKVVVNDLGGSRHGEGANAIPADQVVAEIRAAGGEAIANYDSVEDGEKIVQAALDTYGRLDILINNAGILRDTSFHKMSHQDWELIYRVHLLGSFKTTHAAWPHLRDQGYGRVIFTTSAAGIYGNFGQANYSSAKLGLLGLANTLALEGQKRNVLVNTIAPIAGSRLTETVLPTDLVAALKPDYVAPLVAYLCHENSTTNGAVFELGAGWVSRLRWQRSKGAFFPLNTPMTPEKIAEQWAVINDFTEAENPTTVQDAFPPVMQNLKTAESAPAKPGNEFVDLDKALGHEFEPKEIIYTERDVSLYALSVGAATNPIDPQELTFVYELDPNFQALPTFAVTFPFVVMGQVTNIPGLTFNPMMLLHGEQYLEVKRPIPTIATLINRAKISQIYDKGKGALVIVDVTSTDEQGNEIAFNQSSLFIRGIGNFGGQRGPSGDTNQPPNRPPDAVQREKTNENQALIYRLSSGDKNPLHVDPAMSAMGGFDRPILHGLCTFGFAGRAVLKQFANNDPSRFKSIKVRFSKHVFPGETIVTEMWRESDTRILFQCKVEERNEVVLSNAVVELFAEGEVKSEERRERSEKREVAESLFSPRSSPLAPPPPAPPKSLALFEAIHKQIQENPALLQQVGAVYQFSILGGEGGEYVVDLKNAPGGAYVGANTAVDCVVTMAYEDMIAMLKGELKPQIAFIQGKLKVKGNVILAAKLAPLFA